MNILAPQALGASHRLEEFDCGKPALTQWLLQHARQAQGSGSARTFVANLSLPTTEALIDRLKADRPSRRLCGFFTAHRIPGKHRFPPAFAEFAEVRLAQYNPRMLN